MHATNLLASKPGLLLASKPGLLPQFRTQLRAPTIKCVGGKTEGEGLDDFRT